MCLLALWGTRVGGGVCVGDRWGRRHLCGPARRHRGFGVLTPLKGLLRLVTGPVHLGRPTPRSEKEDDRESVCLSVCLPVGRSVRLSCPPTLSAHPVRPPCPSVLRGPLPPPLSQPPQTGKPPQFTIPLPQEPSSRDRTYPRLETSHSGSLLVHCPSLKETN